MFQNFIDGLRVLADLFAAYPIQFTLGTIIIVTLIYYKWVWIGRAQRNAVKRGYAGWKVDGSADGTDRLVMRPVKMRAVSLWALAFFGGGAVFLGLVELPKTDVENKTWLAFVGMCLFACGAVWLFLMSFTRITFDGEVLTQSGLVVKTLARPVAELSDIRPISKTIAGGVYLYFGNQDRVRVAANMSGYRQLLEALTQHHPTLRMQVAAYADAIKRQL